MTQLDEVLDSFVEELGLPRGSSQTVENEARRLLALTSAELHKMTGEDCGEASFLLERFALHLQNAQNREQARVRWAEESVSRIITPILNQQQGYGLAERRLLAIRNDDAASKMDGLRVKHQLRLDRIAFMSAKVSSLSRTMKDLQQSKRGKYDHD